MTDETIKKVYECEKCKLRFESYDEALEHEKNCMPEEEKEEIIEEKEKKEVQEAIKEAEKIIEEEEKPEEIMTGQNKDDEYVNTDVEKELNIANDADKQEQETDIVEKEEIKEDIKEDIQKIKEEITEIKKEIEPEIKPEVEPEIQISEIKPPVQEVEEKKDEKTKCTLCGLCRLSCPAYSVIFDEAVSPRGKAVLLKKENPSKLLYLCTLCKACENTCVLKDIDLVDKIRDFRRELVRRGIKTESNEKMIENLRKYGNALGKIEPGKKFTLWCC
jgi:formate hydrogenlyase subunit 6/NADH:ubiquinone oxidoreductase subunit I